MEEMECARSRPAFSPLPISVKELFLVRFEAAADENSMLTWSVDDEDGRSPSDTAAIAAAGR